MLAVLVPGETFLPSLPTVPHHGVLTWLSLCPCTLLVSLSLLIRTPVLGLGLHLSLNYLLIGFISKYSHKFIYFNKWIGGGQGHNSIGNTPKLLSLHSGSWIALKLSSSLSHCSKINVEFQHTSFQDWRKIYISSVFSGSFCNETVDSAQENETAESMEKSKSLGIVLGVFIIISKTAKDTHFSSEVSCHLKEKTIKSACAH